MTDTGAICHGCTARVRALLMGVPELMRELTTTLMKRSRVRHTNGPTGSPEIDPVNMPYDVGASKAKGDLKGVLAGWARLVADERPAVLDCRESCTQMSGWLLQHTGWLRRYTAAPDLLTELAESVAAVERVIDVRVPLVYIGPCKPDHGCPGELWAREDAATTTCRACQDVWFVDEVRARNLSMARNMVAPAETVATALSSNGVPVTVERIYKWRARGFIHAVSTSSNGRLLFRLGDIADEWRRRQTPVPKGILK
jgi:hypothetical protein